MYFQDIIFTLQKFWTQQGCVLLQPYDMEVGAGTSHPATLLRCIDAEPWNIVYVQPSRRPADGRYGKNPNRMQHFYQLQVIMKPSPDDMQELCMDCLETVGIKRTEHDIRFVESDWENPTLGASGLGWEVWCDGMEIVQFTYMQQLGGIKCFPIPGEITIGLERLAMYIQNIDSCWEIEWNNQMKYRDIFLDSEIEYSVYNFELANVELLSQQFQSHLEEAKRLLKHKNIHPAYDHCLKASHLFNVLDARNALSVSDRAAKILEIRAIVTICCEKWYAFKRK